MKDSISRAGGYHNPYSAQNFHRHPNATSNRGVTSGLSGGKDSLEISQEKLEQQVAARFHANNFQLPNQGLAIVARAGKYLFYAVALPPYVLLYAIPKWLFFVAMPEIMLVLKENLMKGCRALKERFSLWISPYAAPLLEFLKQMKTFGSEAKNNFFMTFIKAPWQALRTFFVESKGALYEQLAALKEKLGEFSDEMKETLRAIGQKMKTAVKRMTRAPFIALKKKVMETRRGIQKRVQALKNAPKHILDAMKRLGEGVAEPFKRLARSTRANYKAVKDGLKNIQNAFKERFAHVFLPWIAPMAPNLFQKLMNRWTKQNPDLKKAIQERAQERVATFAPLFNAVAMLKKALKAAMQPRVLARNGLNKLKQKGEDAGKFLTENFITPLKEGFNKRLDKAKRALERAQKLASKTGAKLQEIPQQLAMLLPTPLINLLGIQLNPNLVPWALVQKQRKLRARVAKKFKFVSAGMKIAKGWAVSAVHKLQDRANAFCRPLWKLVDKLKGLQKKTAEGLVEVKMAYRRRKHWVRLMMAWCKVLMRHWMKKMREFASQIGKKTRKKMHLEKLVSDHESYS